jgi:hypothetical protein
MEIRAWHVMENKAGQGKARQVKARQGKKLQENLRTGQVKAGRSVRCKTGHGGTGGAGQDKLR